MILHSVLPSCKVKHLLLQFLLLFAALAESMKTKIHYSVSFKRQTKLVLKTCFDSNCQC